ncbi:MAG: CapA family protein [Actinomycetota bacterium]
MRHWRLGRLAIAVTGTLLAASLEASAAGNDESASAAAGAVRTDAPDRTLSVLLGGDILTEDRVLRVGAAAAAPGERYDFAPALGPVAAIVGSVDLAICHMELPIGGAGERPGVYGRSPFGGNLLLAPYEMADALRHTGFDRCSTASNHSTDVGTPGIDSTLAALDDAGISHVGTARTSDEALDTVFVVNGVRVSHLAYTRYSNTARPREPWRLNFAATPQQVTTDVAAVRAAGAEVVIVSLHLSQEMQRGPSTEARAFTTELTALTDIDLVVHHGPHVVQPVERVNGTVVYWSVGNLISAMGTPGRGRYSDPRSLDGLLATARFTELSPGEFEVEPWTVLICNEAVDRTVRAPVAELADGLLAPSKLAEMQACVDRSSSIAADLH